MGFTLPAFGSLTAFQTTGMLSLPNLRPTPLLGVAGANHRLEVLSRCRLIAAHDRLDSGPSLPIALP
jgi:hypothetical protein